MNRKSLILTLALAVALSAPVATASWISHGNQEPSTKYDTAAFMPLDPTTDERDAVYFNAFETHQVATSQNPNSGTLQTRVQPFPSMEFDAMLGLWKDCNQDGYVGLVESAILEYRAELLTVEQQNICPTGSGYSDGQWVTEYRTFGAADPCAWVSPERHEDENDPCFVSDIEKNPGVIYVNNTRIWGNIGRPDHIETPAATCTLSPVPKGATSSTGLLIRYGECIVSLATHINTIDGATGGVLGLGFTDPNNPHHDAEHPLNRGLPVNLYGNPVEGQDGETGLIQEDDTENGRDAPTAFTTWDCNGSRNTVRDPTAGDSGTGDLHGIPVQDSTGLVPRAVADPTGGEEIELADEDGTIFTISFTDDNGEIFGTPALGPSVGNPTGSYWEGAGDFVDGFDDCEETTGNEIDGLNGADLLDAANEGNAGAPARRQSDFTFFYSDGLGDILIDIFFDESLLADATGPATPYDGGLSGLRWYTGPSWYSTPNYVTGTPMVNTRTDLEPAEPSYYSFFAGVDMDVVNDGGYVLPGTTYYYGSEQCTTTGPGAGIQNGWDCDPTKWYKDATGTNTSAKFAEGQEISARVGQAYQLRDVDCFDNHIAADVYAGTFTPCEGPIS